MRREELLSRLLDESRRAWSINLLDARRHVWDEAHAVGCVGALSGSTPPRPALKAECPAVP